MIAATVMPVQHTGLVLLVAVFMLQHETGGRESVVLAWYCGNRATVKGMLLVLHSFVMLPILLVRPGCHA